MISYIVYCVIACAFVVALYLICTSKKNTRRDIVEANFILVPLLLTVLAVVNVLCSSTHNAWRFDTPYIITMVVSAVCTCIGIAIAQGLSDFASGLIDPYGTE